MDRQGHLFIFCHGHFVYLRLGSLVVIRGVLKREAFFLISSWMQMMELIVG